MASESDWVFRDRYPGRIRAYRRMDRHSDALRATGTGHLGIRYGSHPRQAFDLFAAAPGAVLVVFIHGGYWQGLSRERFSFVAGPLRAAGFSVALPSYPLAPEVALPGIVHSVDSAVDTIIDHLARSGVPPRGWIAAGHSAGGHLALLAAGRMRAVPLLGVVALSPLCDLAPLRSTSLNAALRLTDTQINTLSPMRLPLPPAPVRLLVGADETDGFRAQALDYAARAQQSGTDCSARLLAGRNHYSIPLEIEQPGSQTLCAFNQLRALSSYSRGARE